MSHRPLPPGRRVGDWEVTAPIGTGGWATVYAGRRADRGDDTADDVALKILPTEGLAPRQARKVAETARREVELARRARHPRLIPLLGSFVLSEPGDPFLDGAIVLVMERAERSLRDALEDGATDGGPTEAEAGRIVAEICEGLAHLHATGWVHGDLKPDNVLLMADGSVRLSDFGLATELTGDRGTHGYAPPMGTFDYLPPERWKAPLGEHGVTVRPSADIWALGIIIHQVFASGASPFPGATPVSRAASTQEYAEGRAPLRMDNAVPPFWRALAADCLAPTHSARAAHTAESLLARINARQDARPEGAGSGGKAGRHRLRTCAAVVAVAVCAVVAGWASVLHDPGSAPPPGPGSAPNGRIRVFNVERSCQDRQDRNAECSLGLAIDPLRPYTIDNVVPARVWHDDVLAVDCQLSHGVPIVDETGTWSADWFRVRLPRGSARPTAWLPAVRTKDRPALPVCPRPTPSYR
ncbi:serine/threonine-protein kinase [Streptomyces ehimensis]|uniref:non-specific serine/threonine protein kinase n=1 Tax=Streptomyces ehimensis TaxID=68195 RepID=A0ABV9BF31_9ACTN